MSNEDKDDDPFKDFENEDKLNLTLDEKQEGKINYIYNQILEEKLELNPEIEKEFSNFLKQTGGTPGTENFDMMNECQKLLENMCMPQSNSSQQQANSNATTDPFNFQTLFQQMSGGADANQDSNQIQPTFDDFADKLLDQFLEKDVLYEPLNEAYINFEKLLNEKKYDVTKEKQYLEQFGCIKQILDILVNCPEKKTEMIELFEKMQTFGDPPEEIIKLIGPDNPIGNYWNFNNNNSNNNDNNSANNNQPNINNLNEECRIF